MQARERAEVRHAGIRHIGDQQRQLLQARAQVAALPKLWVPPADQPNAPPPQGQGTTTLQTEDPNDEWADAKEAEDIYNVNDRALYTDFD